MNSRDKGQRGEREAAAELRRIFGCAAHRAQQFCGAAGDADLATSLDGIHFEVKRTERLQLYPALAQAAADCGENTPIVLHRANHKPWVVILELDRLPEAVTRLYLHLANRTL